MDINREYDIGFYNDTEVVHIPCKQYATGCVFDFYIINKEGLPVDLTGYSISFYESKADGCFIEENDDVLDYPNGDYNNVVTLTTNEQMTAAVGTNTCELRVQGDEQSQTDTYTGTGFVNSFELSHIPNNTPTVTVNGTETTDFTTSGTILTFTNGNPIGEIIVDYEYYATDISTWKFYIEVSDSVHGAGIESASIIVTIDEYVKEAKEAAERAEESALNASVYAGLANTSATNAASSADNAALSASNALTSATNAANSASDALASATTAGARANEASASATSAANSATTAGTKADEASASATNAASSATTASTKANEAATSATNSANSATAAATSETNAEHYADLAAEYAGGIISETTILASGWNNSAYSFETEYPSSSYNIEVSVSPTGATAQSQYDAWGEAQLVGNANSNVIVALGTVPSIDIPVIVRSTPVVQQNGG